VKEGEGKKKEVWNEKRNEDGWRMGGKALIKAEGDERSDDA